MIEAIFNSADLVDLLHEDPAVTKKRIACQQIVDALRKAKDILNEVRAFKV
jgi:dynamin 1-like protein